MDTVKEIGGIPVTVRKGRFKTIRIVVDRYGGVRMNVPYGVAEAVAETFFRSKLSRIEKMISRNEPENELCYRDGDEVYLWGERKEVFIGSEGKNGVYLSGEYFRIVPGKKRSPAETAEAFFTEELLRKGRAALDRWAFRTGLSYTVFRVRKTLSRWGSCNVKTGGIHLSLYLANLPEACLDYVALHEICHLRFPDHGKDFHAMLAMYMPDYKARCRMLKDGNRMRAIVKKPI